MTNRKLFACVSVLFSLTGCNDEEVKAGSAQTAAICERVCTRAAAPRCVNSEPNCAMECVAVLSDSPVECDAQLDAFTDCQLRATFTCDANGEADAVACSSLYEAWAACYQNGGSGVGGKDAGTFPNGANDGGSSPLPGNADAGVVPSSDAGSANADAGSVQSDAGRPIGDAGTSSPVSDAGTSQPTDAGTSNLLCAPAAQDDACDTCLKTTCCEEVSSCGSACQALGGCIAECETEDCADACFAALPDGIEQFDAIAECALTACEVACADAP